MPATAELTNNASTQAFKVPANAVGFIIWSKVAYELRVRIGKPASSSGDNEGIPVPAGNISPSYYTHYFSKPPREPVWINIFQSSGGAISSGVGYDILMN